MRSVARDGDEEMQIRTVSSKELTPKSLRAADYVPSPKRIAKEVVDDWVKSNPVLSRKSPAMKELETRIAVALQKLWLLIR